MLADIKRYGEIDYTIQVNQYLHLALYTKMQYIMLSISFRAEAHTNGGREHI
jgi:hypothetical protein